MPSCGCTAWVAGHGDRSCGPHQYLRDAIVGGALGTGVAADTDTLLSLSDPEPAVLLAQRTALGVQQNETQRAIACGLDKE